jgi:hypothetical protein
MLRHASPRFEGLMVSVIGERFRARDYSASYRRWCPDCLLETGSHRTWWELPYVTSCPRHGIALSESCICGERPTWAASPSVLHCRCGRELSSSRAETLDAGDVAFDAYLINRMTGERAQAVRWLDAMEMHEAMDAVRAVGRFVLDPFSETAFSHRQEDRRRLMSAGFNAILDIPAAVAATLGRIYAGMAHMLAPPHFMYSDEFRCWLVRDFRNGLKDAIRHCIRQWTETRTLGLGPHDVPYGYFALEHAGVTCGFDLAYVRNVMALHRKPLSGPMRGSVDPVTMAWLRHHVGNRRTAREVADELDVPLREVFPLMREGLVKPFAKVPGVAFLFFSPDEPGRLVRRIEVACRRNGDAATSLLPLPAVSRSLGVPVAVLAKAVLDGDLRAARVSRGSVGLSRYLVDVDAIPPGRFAGQESP